MPVPFSPDIPDRKYAEAATRKAIERKK